MITIKTFIINLEERIQRRLHIESEFSNRHEFDLTIVKAVKDEVGSWGLWMNIRRIIEIAKNPQRISARNWVFTKPLSTTGKHNFYK